MRLLLFSLFISLGFAREITFPSQSPLGIDISTPGLDLNVSNAKFAGLQTYANLPYVSGPVKFSQITENDFYSQVHCLAANQADVEPYDIAILGAPFDTGTTARPGARFGPGGIRLGSRRIAPDFAYSVYNGKNAFQQGMKVVDCGDVALTVLVSVKSNEIENVAKYSLCRTTRSL